MAQALGLQLDDVLRKGKGLDQRAGIWIGHLLSHVSVKNGRAGTLFVTVAAANVRFGDLDDVFGADCAHFHLSPQTQRIANCRAARSTVGRLVVSSSSVWRCWIRFRRPVASLW